MPLFERPGLRVLMYHRVDRVSADELTVTPAQIDAHLRHLQSAGHSFITASALVAALASGDPLPVRPVLVTFDDAYRSTHELALPLLRSLGVPATVFVPTGHIGGVNAWDSGRLPLMTAEQLAAIVAGGFEIGFHSHRHANYRGLTGAGICRDLEEGLSTLWGLGIPFVPVLAYPYGGRPTGRAARKGLRESLRHLGLAAAFRIGNRVNPLPIADPYELNRFSVRGDRSLEAFVRHLRWGRWGPLGALGSLGALGAQLRRRQGSQGTA